MIFARVFIMNKGPDKVSSDDKGKTTNLKKGYIVIGGIEEILI